MAELVREIIIDARPETVFAFLTQADKHVEWEGTEATIDARPGGVYDVLIAGQHRGRGEYVEVVPFERVVHTFGWDMPGNPITPGSTTVTYELFDEDGKTRVRLTHSGLPADAVSDHTHGWDHYLARLATVGAGRDAGPDTPF